MKKIITLYNLNSINELSKYADGFIVGNQDFSARITNSFSIAEINEIIKMSQELKKEVFLNVNQMFTDKQLADFKEIFVTINYLDLTGIIVADLGTLILLTELGLANKVIYNPETLLTNTFDFNYLSTDNIFGAYVSKELTLEDILKIGINKEYKMFLVGHGHLNMFYSKRHLLDNYQELTNKELSFNDLQNLKIIEPKRSATPYPILQDKSGTHVFRSKVKNAIKYMDSLSSVVDYFIIDTIFKDDKYALDILKIYENSDEELISKILNDYNEIWDHGFLDNKTYYKRKS